MILCGLRYSSVMVQLLALGMTLHLCRGCDALSGAIGKEHECACFVWFSSLMQSDLRPSALVWLLTAGTVHALHHCW